MSPRGASAASSCAAKKEERSKNTASTAIVSRVGRDILTPFRKGAAYRYAPCAPKPIVVRMDRKAEVTTGHFSNRPSGRDWKGRAMTKWRRNGARAQTG